MAEAGALSAPLRWALLLGLSAAFAGVLEAFRLPAGLLIGPMVAAIILAVRGQGVTVPSLPFQAAQAFVGLLIANSFNAGTVHTVIDHGPLFLATTVATLSVGVGIGWLIARLGWLPGSVAVWGCMPGGAAAMVLMAQSYGAEWRLVAVMTYSRVACVAGAASVVAALVGAHGGATSPTADWFPPIDPLAFAETLAIAAVGAWLGIRLKLPAAPMIGALILGSALNIAGLVRFDLPGWLLAASYAVVGWRIGLHFTRDIVKAAARVLPRILLSIALLIGISACIGFLLARFGGVDPVTAYLATSPGGMDSVAIIAASTRVDVPYVMALQALRFFACVVAGPALARFAAKRQGQALA
ncbi:MAG: AbrB protein [Sphingomonas bacterium]|uniref:AbrB family transcriptional regulator n=1 Tax=Sphingomonas bacterium TaxID=1895847 RepID=UPI0026112785|nr:AbrB family transcriptional regulator [Sphingomonas bacterium]MDB5707915.1 AbrB protein [Sphingomonas bacterium]